MLRGAAITAAAGTAAAVTTTAAQAAPAAPAFPATSRLPRGLDLETATVADLRPLLDSSELTSQTLTAAYLERIEALSNQRPAVNAVRMVNPLALEEARAADQMLKSYQRSGKPYSPLLGIPVLIKDNIDATPMPTTAGSVALAHSYPKVDAPLVRQLRAAGAVIIAKGNLTEFANYLTNGMPGGYSSLGGQVLNAYDASQTPSGSSAGPGVAASVGLATLTIGTETSGSILGPSAANSDVGIKPSTGLVSRTGIVPIAASQDTAGPIVKSVADAAALLTVICAGLVHGRQPARRSRLHQGPEQERPAGCPHRRRRQPGAGRRDRQPDPVERRGHRADAARRDPGPGHAGHQQQHPRRLDGAQLRI